MKVEDNDAPNGNFLFLMVSIKKKLELTLWHLVVSVANQRTRREWDVLRCAPITISFLPVSAGMKRETSISYKQFISNLRCYTPPKRTCLSPGIMSAQYPWLWLAGWRCLCSLYAAVVVGLKWPTTMIERKESFARWGENEFWFIFHWPIH